MHLIKEDFYHQLKNQLLSFDVVIAFNGFEQELKNELLLKGVKILFIENRLFFTEPQIENFFVQIIWKQDHWSHCQSVMVDSLVLKNLPQKLAYHFKNGLQKNTNLKSQNTYENKIYKISHVPEKRITFEKLKKPQFSFFVWTLYKDIMIYSECPWAKYPVGWHEFNENKIDPPNRAYLKLWESIACHDLNFDSHRSQSALEIGASPGGWSWVLSSYFKTVYTIDRAALDPKISKIANIKHSIGDAFKVDVNNYSDCNWFFSDIICSPEKLYETVQFWLDHSQIQNFLCTIKFKGQCDFQIIEKFLNIPDSKIVRLYHNKNEVTWIKNSRK